MLRVSPSKGLFLAIASKLDKAAVQYAVSVSFHISAQGPDVTSSGFYAHKNPHKKPLDNITQDWHNTLSLTFCGSCSMFAGLGCRLCAADRRRSMVLATGACGLRAGPPRHTLPAAWWRGAMLIWTKMTKHSAFDWSIRYHMDKV